MIYYKTNINISNIYVLGMCIIIAILHNKILINYNKLIIIFHAYYATVHISISITIFIISK